MEKKKNSNKKFYFLFVIIYLLIGVVIYFCIKNYHKNDNNNEYITDSVEVTDEVSLNYALNYNKNDYALIYGTFMTIDTIYDTFFGNDYSYINEVTIDTSEDPESILLERKRSSHEFSIYGIKVNGLNFDLMQPIFHKSMNDIKHKNIRYDYYIKPVEYTGTMLCKINEDESIECIKFYRYETIQSIRQSGIKENYLMENSFIILWLIMLLMIIMNIDPDSDKFEEIKL